MAGPECIEEPFERAQCWDCPERKGLSRWWGNRKMKFYKGLGALGVTRIQEQRGDCEGFVPARLQTSTSGAFVEKDGRMISDEVVTEVYVRACSRTSADKVPEFPDEVRRAMHDNDMPIFIRTTPQVRDLGTVEEYEQRLNVIAAHLEAMAGLRAEHIG